MSNTIEERMYRKGIAKAPISLANLRRINAAKQSYVNNHFNMYGELPPRNAYGFLPPIQETGQPGSYAFPLTAANRAKVLPRANTRNIPPLANYEPPRVPPSSPVSVPMRGQPSSNLPGTKRPRSNNINVSNGLAMKSPLPKRPRTNTNVSNGLAMNSPLATLEEPATRISEPLPTRKRGGKSRRRNRNRTHKK